MVTKSDIARAAGVSRTCVSLVLNDRPGVRIAASTRQRVLDVARRLGYHETSNGDGHGRSLSAVAYVLGTGGSPHSQLKWHFSVLDEIQRYVVNDDRCVIYTSVTEAPAAITKVLGTIDRTQPLGVLLDGVVSESLVHELQARQIPFVIMGVTPFAHDPAWADKVNTVSVDVQDGVHQLVHWLAEHGARSIAFACESLHLLVNRLIVQAYQDAVRDLDLKYDPALVQVCSTDVDGRHLLSRFRELGVQYDGLLIGALSLTHTVLNSMSGQQPSAADRPPLVATFGPGGADEPIPPDAASVYVQRSEYTRLAYDLLSAQIKYPGRKPQHLRMQCAFHDPTRTTVREA